MLKTLKTKLPTILKPSSIAKQVILFGALKIAAKVVKNLKGKTK